MKGWKPLLGLVVILSCSSALQAPLDRSVDPDNILVNDVPNAKNIILLIGDGLGLAQITAANYMNRNRTALEEFKVVGLHKTHAYDDLVTDSAAGATAFSCGVKTVNGAIGVDHLGQTRETILEEAERKGLATGLVATSTIVHATPASFAAHVPSRRQYEEIALDFMRVDVDLMIGGGRAFFTRRQDEKNLYEDLKGRNYYVSDYLEAEVDDLEIPNGANLAYFTSDKEPLSVIQGRDYLIPATKLSLDFLKDRSEDGFFIMIESSQIDWGGHANDASYVVEEYLEFDEVIEICYKFAKNNGETLVVVTADHETGGLAVNPESTMGDLKTAFTTGGHTACMIPVFAYGPGAERFSGIYDNTKIYDKLRQAYGWKK